MSNDEAFEAAIKRIERIAGLNSEGMAVRDWNAATDDFSWVYAGLRYPCSHSLRIKLSVTVADQTVPWVLLKEAIRLMRAER